MSKTTRLFLAAALAASITAPLTASAAELRNVSCSVSVNYLLNNVVRSAYQKDFVIAPGVAFQDDFSTFTRFRFLDASSRLEADGKTTSVSLSYYNDVGVFEAVDFRTELKIHDDKTPETASGTHSYWSSLGVAGDHTTSYSLTCRVLKD